MPLWRGLESIAQTWNLLPLGARLLFWVEDFHLLLRFPAICHGILQQDGNSTTWIWSGPGHLPIDQVAFSQVMAYLERSFNNLPLHMPNKRPHHRRLFSEQHLSMPRIFQSTARMQHDPPQVSDRSLWHRVATSHPYQRRKRRVHQWRHSFIDLVSITVRRRRSCMDHESHLR